MVNHSVSITELKLINMDSKELKNNILQRIGQIDDEVLLQYIQDFLDASDKYYIRKSKDIDISHEASDEDKIDFTDYIKEWIKDM